MAKLKLEFDMLDPDSKEEAKLALQGAAATSALWDIAQDIFRPARKHGYPNSNKININEWSEETFEAVSKLEELFWEIIANNKVEIE